MPTRLPDDDATRPLRILFLGLNYAPEKVGIAVYSAGLCRSLAAEGHDVRGVVGAPYYPDWNTPVDHRGIRWRRTREDGVDVTRCPIYVPTDPGGLKRIVHHVSFALSTLVPLLLRGRAQKPDIVMTVAPSLIAAPVARFVAWATGARSWLHVQDFELEAAFATGLLDAKSRIRGLAEAFQHRVLTGFDRVSSIGPEMCDKLARLGVPGDRIVELRNWAEDAVTPRDAPSSYRTTWSITEPHVALYSGNIANKQGIEIVIEAARLLSHRRDLRFVICGNGANRARLAQEAAGQDNVSLHDLQPVAALPDLLSLATLHLLPQRADAADLVLPSKLTNMLASGRPVVATANPGTGLAREVAGCGVCVSPGDAPAFAAAIEALLDDPARRIELGQAARSRAETVWGRRAIIAGVEAAWRTMAGKRRVREPA